MLITSNMWCYKQPVMLQAACDVTSNLWCYKQPVMLQATRDVNYKQPVMYLC